MPSLVLIDMIQVQKHISLSAVDFDRIVKKADTVGLSFSAFVRLACYSYPIKLESPRVSRND